MPRKLTGQLILRESGYYGRYWANQDGKRVRVSVSLGTLNREQAEARLARLVASNQSPEVLKEETFAESVERVHPRILDAQVENARQQGADEDHLARIRMYGKDALHRIRTYAVPVIGAMPITTVGPADVCSALRYCRVSAGKSHQTMLHLKKHMLDLFSELRREQTISRNPVRDIDPDDLPKPPPKNLRKKPRAVLTDEELAIYLRYSSKDFHQSVRERQVMSVLARIVGGMRTGDLHGLRWEDLGVDGGRFGTVYVPREKTGEPDWFVCPAVLRPFLAFWWELTGCPSGDALVFPASRGKRLGERKIKVSHARALKRDVSAAFEAARAAGIDAPEKGTERWAQLFTETSRTRPVDFHSWRRVFVQQTRKARRALDQHSMPLSGHRSASVHQLYAEGIAGEVKNIPAESMPTCLDGIVDAWYAWWRSIDPEGFEKGTGKRQRAIKRASGDALGHGVTPVNTRDHSAASLPALCHAGGRGFESRPPR